MSMIPDTYIIPFAALLSRTIPSFIASDFAFSTPPRRVGEHIQRMLKLIRDNNSMRTTSAKVVREYADYLNSTLLSAPWFVTRT